MTGREGSLERLRPHLDILCCPGCGGDLDIEKGGLVCSTCHHEFSITDNIPQLYWPNDWDPSKKDVTQTIREFYEETPFPNYDDFDSVGSLLAKARRSVFGKMLDDQVPFGTRVLECGCGTGQMTNFLSVANRTVFGTDICLNSLRLGQQFSDSNQLERTRFLQMNLFRPAFRAGTFDLVICNGVLHHTSEPFLGFQSISHLVRRGGFILIGLYHRYGRLITDLRRTVFKLTSDRLKSLDPNLRRRETAEAKRKAWFMDQYKNPHESKHTIGQVLQWIERIGFTFVHSIPNSVPFQPFTDSERLFERQPAGNALERLIVESGMVFKGSAEGGFFTMIARRDGDS